MTNCQNPQLLAVWLNLWSDEQEIWANAHETHNSISVISSAGCLDLFPVILVKFHSKCASQPEITKNSLKPPILGVEGHRCWYWKARQSGCYDELIVVK